jgi:hypothetical protein
MVSHARGLLPMKRLMPPLVEMSTFCPATTRFRIVTGAMTAAAQARRRSARAAAPLAPKSARRATAAHAATARATARKLGTARHASPAAPPAAAHPPRRRLPEACRTRSRNPVPSRVARPAGSGWVLKKTSGPYNAVIAPASHADRRPKSRHASAAARTAVKDPITPSTSLAAGTEGPARP